ncbi:MAG: 50S ribosomal protein L25 [Dethiobacteria bacterium]
MERIALEAVLRSGRGTRGELNRLRQENQVPAVVYGRGKETLSLVVDGGALHKALSSDAGENAIIELEIMNGKKKGKKTIETVMFKELQRDILYSERLLHIDFIRISLTEKISADVPLQVVGDMDSPGVKEGGVVQLLKRDVQVFCLPAEIPDFLEIDISSLEIGDGILAQELVVPENIELQTDPEEMLVQVLMPQEEEEEEEEVEEEAEEAAEVTEEDGEAPAEGESSKEAAPEE